MTALAMFPLGTVLFPTLALPLNVFEPRYRAMVHDLLDAPEPVFGVVLIERGSEVGGGEVRTAIGTVARILEVAELDDGRFALSTVGTQRFEVLEWLDDAPYPRAEVMLLDDGIAGDDLAERHTENLVLLRRTLALKAELREPAAPATIELSSDVVLAGYQAAALAPFGPADHQRLLAAPDPSARAALLHDLLAEERAMLQLRISS